MHKLSTPLAEKRKVFNKRSMAARHEERRAINKTIVTRFRVCKGPSNDDVEMARGTVFQETRPGAGIKNR